MIQENPNGLYDCHVHTSFCGHAAGTMEESVQYAIQSGLSGIGFAGHHPYPAEYKTEIKNGVIPPFNFPLFINEVHRLKIKYKDSLDILLGAELDFLPDYTSWSREAVQLYPYDYIYGSVHCVDNICIDYCPNVLKKNLIKWADSGGLWFSYWNHMEKMIETMDMDIVAHFDLLKKFSISGKDKTPFERIDAILDLILKHNLAIEINTGGLERSHAREFYPSDIILRRISEKRIPITMGSDAHKPEQAGRYFLLLKEKLKSLGFQTCTLFKNREMIERKL